MKKIVLRIDDVGASTKLFNQHGKIYWKIFKKNVPIAFFANYLFFKKLPPFKQWAIYSEMNVNQWKEIFDLLRKYNAKMTVGITACWAISENELIPFNKKFPDQSSIIREGSEEGLIEIANHGLCHCVLIDNLFHPRMFSSNRKYHREFWDWLPDDYHKEHVEASQEILTRIFKRDIVTFIPPGNVWTETTERYARSVGIQYLSSLEEYAPTGHQKNGITYVGNKNMIDFHDRDIVLSGVDWLQRKLNENPGSFCTVRDYFAI